MKLDHIQQDFRHKVCATVSLLAEGINRYRVFNPFLLEDGDHLCILLKKENGRWFLSDEGHTFMHLSYQLEEKDFREGTRQKIIDNALSVFSVQDREGELVLFVEDELFGDALFSFAQALLKITDITFLTRERVKTAFFEDFENLLTQIVPEERRVFRWHDQEKDPHAMYQVDCRINRHPKPLFVFALLNDDQVRDATITLHQFERWGISYRSLAIFEDQEKINRRVLARFSDIAEKQFSSISGDNRQRISSYLQDTLSP